MNYDRPLTGRDLLEPLLRGSSDFETVVRDFRACLLAYGSETECNQNAAAKIGYGVLTGSNLRVKPIGLHVGPNRTSLADICNALEDLEMPAELRETFEDLSSRDWDAALRIMTLLLSALEKIPRKS